MDESEFDMDLRRLADLSDLIDELDAKRKAANADYDDLEYKLAQYMEQTGCDSKKLDGITFSKTQRAFAKVEDKVMLMDWIQQNNAYDLLMAIHASKVTGYTNECIANGVDTPPGVNPGYIKHGISIRRA